MPHTATPVALVTGCSRPEGLGFAVARLLAERGHYVVLTARDLGRAEALAERIRATGGRASALRLDLTDPATVRAAGAWLTDRFDRLDVLVDNASTYPDFEVTSPLDADLDAVREALEVDVLGPWLLIQVIAPLLTNAPAARIVNIGSVAAQQLTTGLDLGAALRAPAHATGKHLLLALTTAMARAFAGSPVLVNVVDPGQMTTHPERGDDDAGSRSADAAAELVVRVATLDRQGPTGRLFTPTETVPITGATAAVP